MLCPLLLLISLDGFKWDYLEHFGWQHFPNFKIFWKFGIKSHHLNNNFITKTFPNHFSIVTGLFEENHGMVHNYMYDPYNKQFFFVGDISSFWWDQGGEPIWVTNQKHNDNCSHKTHAIMWPGSQSSIKNTFPTYFESYSSKISFRSKIEKIIDSFINKNINLGILYHYEPDNQGHLYGPYSSQVFQMLKNLDADLGYLFKLIKDNKLGDQINIILLSDHGMSNLTGVIYLSEIIDLNSIIIAGNSPTYNLFINASKTRNVYFDKLNEQKYRSQFTVYKKENIPSRWNYQKNRRIGDLLIVGNPGWNILKFKTEKKAKGTHGYDNEHPDSWPIFMAIGSKFTRKFASKDDINLTLPNIDVYSIMCNILNLKPAPNDGSLMRAKFLLADKEEEESYNSSWINEAIVSQSPKTLLLNFSILAICLSISITLTSPQQFSII